MRKVLAAFAILVLAILSVSASTISFVYGSSISSIDMESDVKVGQLYVDQASNVLVVKSVLEGVEYGAENPGTVVEFDKLVSRGEYSVGSELVRRGPLFSFDVYGGLYHSLAKISMTCPLYPLYPLVVAGAGYDLVSAFSGESLSVRDALVLGGIGISFPIARLWDSGFTLIENGKIGAWCAAGISASDSVTFAFSYGFSYRHNVGPFHWELGAMWLKRLGEKNRISPYLGLGVDI